MSYIKDNFLLTNKTAEKLYFDYASKMPIFDYHCHLPEAMILANEPFADIYEIWLKGDHYKWRQMRTNGVDEEYITGGADEYEKFKAFARTVPYLICNPLYHWTHLELQRYFGIETPLTPATADAIWNEANAKIKAGGFTPRELIERSNVVGVCTTDDPADTLEYHKLIAADESFKCKVMPAFRPEKAMNIEMPTFIPWLDAMAKTAGREIDSYATLKEVLVERMNFFEEMGCHATDHSLAYVPCLRATEDELEAIFAKALNNEPLTVDEQDKYKTELFRFFAKEYAEKGWGCEIHIGPMRNNNTLMFNKIGADAGFDSIDSIETPYPICTFEDERLQKVSTLEIFENENGFYAGLLKGILNGRPVYLYTYGQNGNLTPGTTYEVNNRLIRHLHGEI